MKKQNKNKLSLLLLVALIQSAYASPITLSPSPLFLSTTTVPNIMVLEGNSNSMDEQADGQAVGSAAAASKSEITRAAIKSIINTYQGKMNVGLMGYAQNSIVAQDLMNSPYDISYNPAHYDPVWVGARNSITHKKFRATNPTDPTKFIYYNVALPSYGGVQANKANDNLYCYTTDTRSKAFNNGEVIVNNIINGPGSGPWLNYDCYLSKTGIVNAGPTAGAANNAPTSSAATANYNGTKYGPYNFYPTDSDLAQGITNYGNQLSQFYVSQSWFSNTSPGYGYVHTPIALLNAAQTTALNKKLATSQFTTGGTEKNAAYPLVNAGLSPIAGAVNTAGKYFAGNLTSANEGGTLPAPPVACGQNYMLLLTDGLPSVLANGNISYDTPTLLNDLTTSVNNIRVNQSVKSYVVGFALPYGVSISQLNDIAVAGGTTNPLYADDITSLNNALNTVFTDIVARNSAASSVALNSGYISTGDKVYQARFSSADWTGDLLAIPLSSTGALPTDIFASASWRAGQVVTTQTPASRVIITTKASNGKGIPFKWPLVPATPLASEMDAAQSTMLNTDPNTSTVDGKGSLRLNFLRGDQSNEGASAGQFRIRSSTLGDIIDSSPILVKAPQANYLTSDYLAFKSTYANRTPVIYVGANDGMLHGINANNGREVFGFVPNAVYNNLARLPVQGYTHRYFVDGSPSSSDVKYADNSWHTVLASGMGNGAPGIFVLDVTNPTNFTEANAASMVKFEFSTANDADVGYIQAAPSIVKLNNGKWAAIFGNGWNNTGSGQSALFVVDIETGALIKKISTGQGSAGTPNGLANPTPVDVDGNGTVDYIYAGDLYGNMWKFDLTGSAPTNWKVAFSGSPLFAGGANKPITEQPDVTISPNGGYMVLYGTGQYLQNSDLTNNAQQTFYGIWDNATGTVTGSQLQAQTITQVNPTYRNVTTTVVNYATKKGWYTDLPLSGERSVTDPVLAGGKIFFSTLTPSSTSCSYGGSSWLMALDYLNGAQPTKPTYDTNGDGSINSSDSNYSGYALTGIASSPTILKGLGTSDKPLQELFFNLSSGAVLGVYTTTSQKSSSRSAWRTIIQK
jgi:type IV pilus assembly protein PilY1